MTIAKNAQIQLQQVSFTANNKMIIQPLDLLINKYEKILLLGPNGCGKSTLIKLLAGWLKGKGYIDFFGYSVFSAQRKKITMLIPQLLEFPAKLKILELLYFVQAHYKNSTDINSILKNFDLQPDEYASRLSGGQKKRLLIALTLVANPDVLLLDEVDAGLDIAFREMFYKELFTSQNPKTIVMITHQLEDIIHFFDRILILNNGSILANLSLKDFYAYEKQIVRFDLFTHDSNKVYDSILNSQFTASLDHQIACVHLGKHAVRLLVTKMYADQVKALENHKEYISAIVHQPTSKEDIYLYLSHKKSLSHKKTLSHKNDFSHNKTSETCSQAQ